MARPCAGILQALCAGCPGVLRKCALALVAANYQFVLSGVAKGW